MEKEYGSVYEEAVEYEKKNMIIPALRKYDYAYRHGYTLASEKLKSMFKKYSLQARLGNHNAQLYLAYMYASGILVEKNSSLAESLYIKAIASNEAIAYFYCGEFYEFRSNNKADKDKAIFYYLEAGKKGFAKGYNNLGFIYETMYEDFGEYTYLEKAIDYYNKGVLLEDADCAYSLAILYLDKLPTIFLYLF